MNNVDVVKMSQKARELAESRSNPILALKMYSSSITAMKKDDPLYQLCLLDYVLCCNCFALRYGAEARNSSILTADSAIDYFELAMEALSTSCGTVWDESAETDMEEFLSSPPEGLDTSTPLHRLATKLPSPLLASASLTLSNWACVELCAGRRSPEMASLLFRCSHRIRAPGVDSTSMGRKWQAAELLNGASCALARCDFADANATLEQVFSLIMGDHLSGEVPSFSDGNASNESMDSLTISLLALYHYMLGVVKENHNCEEATVEYEESMKLFSKSGSNTFLTSSVQRTVERLATFMEEERQRRRAAFFLSEEKARHTVMSRAKSVKPMGKGKDTAVKVGHKQAKTRLSAMEVTSPICAPLISDALRQYLQNVGLSSTFAGVFSLENMFDALSREVTDGDGRKVSFTPLFSNVQHAGARVAGPVLAICMCTETPLQWSQRAQDAAQNIASPQAHSVWSPPPVVPSFLLPPVKKPQVSNDTVVSLQTKARKDGSSKLRQQLQQMFSPPGASVAAKRRAQSTMEDVLKQLGQRLTVLLKGEKQFEDRWCATERIRSALCAYAVPQDLMRLKRDLIARRRLAEIQREHSARVIVGFFRYILKRRQNQGDHPTPQKTRSHKQMKAAVVLQKYARRWIAQRERAILEERNAEYIRRVTVVQSLFRRRIAMAAFRESQKVRLVLASQERGEVAREYAAMQIQRVYRGHRSRLLQLYKQSLFHEAVLHHFRDSRNYYATIIQKYARRMLVRLRYGRAVYARRCYGRNMYRTQLLERCCLTIQRVYRGYRARRIYGPQLRLSVARSLVSNAATCALIEGVPGSELCRERAARRIQALCRSRAARRRLEALRYAREEGFANCRVAANLTRFSLKDCVF